MIIFQPGVIQTTVYTQVSEALYLLGFNGLCFFSEVANGDQQHRFAAYGAGVSPKP